MSQNDDDDDAPSAEGDIDLDFEWGDALDEWEGEVESSATGHWISSSMRRTYLIALAGRSAQLRAPWVDSCQPSVSS